MLSERQLLILQEIVDNFIRSAQPVGSRSLSKNKDISLSSATIRNEMADLEELGYLEKMHTSSGRIPSQKGYRYYVDHLLPSEKISEEDVIKIRSIFANHIYEYERVVQNAAEILSELTNYTTVLLGPNVNKNRLQRIQIVPITKDTATAIIVTDTGHVEHRTFLMPEQMEITDIEKMVNILNDRLVGIPLINLTDSIKTEVNILLRKHIKHYDQILYSIIDSLTLPTNEKMFFGGKTNMLTQPEFHDIDKVQLLLKMIEEGHGMYDLLKKNPVGIHVKIGKENKVLEMQDCSLITASYSLGSNDVGTIAIIGPTRMEYSRVITILKYFVNDLSNVFTNLYQNK